MIEAHAFLAAFAVQVLVVALLLPALFIRYVRVQTAVIPAERLAQMYPGIDAGLATERFLSRYRALTSVIGVLGLLLLGWLFSYVQRPDWSIGTVTGLATAHLVAGWMVPILFFARASVTFNKEHKRSLPEVKRTAVLQRRGLFDFVSPYIVFVAVLGYVLFAAFMFYVQQHQLLPAFSAYTYLGSITLCYVADAFVVYIALHGKKRNPYESHADRLRTIGLGVKSNVYGCIVMLAFMSLVVSLGLLDQYRWIPFSTSILLIVSALLASMGFNTPLRKPEMDELDTHPAR